ncbi:hypothetical protein DFH06DRAFT_1228051 [Mycena polygramma]|nr:hypothetical protein DFH06DRAFT_1228051 [Mycena polygramma]
MSQDLAVFVFAGVVQGYLPLFSPRTAQDTGLDLTSPLDRLHYAKRRKRQFYVSLHPARIIGTRRPRTAKRSSHWVICLKI